MDSFSVDREAGHAQGIRGTCFEHPLLVYNLGGLRPLGKHYQCYSGTVWCAVQRTPSSLLLLDTHPVGSLSFEGGTLDTQHHFSAPIAYNLICYTSFATTTYQHRNLCSNSAYSLNLAEPCPLIPFRPFKAAHGRIRYHLFQQWDTCLSPRCAPPYKGQAQVTEPR